MNIPQATLPVRVRFGLRRGALVLMLGLAMGAPSARQARDAGQHQSTSWSGPIIIVVAYPTGGVSDRIARLLAARLAQQLGVPVHVENKAGAGGAIALRALSRLPGDGRNLVFSAIMPLAIDPLLGGSGNAITPVADVMATPFLLVGTPAFEGHNFADVLRLARRRPEGLRWATSGVATTGHLVLEQVRAVSGGVITHVPYKGGGQQINDALGGHFELLSTNVGPLQMAYIRDGRFVPLAVGAPNRLRALPEIPTLGELGVPEANHASRFGLFAPGSMTATRARRLNEEVGRALRSPEICEELLEMESSPGGGSVADFAQEIARESQRVRALFRSPP